MPPTTIRGGQVLDGSVQRADLDSTTVGQAVVRKIVQGSGITLSSTGADSGTGDVTVSAATAAVSADAGNQAKLGSDSLVYVPAGTVFISKTAAYTATVADSGKEIICSGGSWTLTLPAPAIGLTYDLRNDMGISGTTGTITVSPTGGTIDGAASLALLPQQECKLRCDGTNWRSFGLKREVILGTQDITTSQATGVVLLPLGYRIFELEWAGLKSVTDGQNLSVQFSTNGGSTWITTTSYIWGLIYNTSTTAVAAVVNNGAISALAGPTMNATTAYGHSRMRLFPGSASLVPNYVSEAGDYNNSMSAPQRMSIYGSMSGAGPVNALQYFAASGNIASSQLTVKGVV